MNPFRVRQRVVFAAAFAVMFAAQPAAGTVEAVIVVNSTADAVAPGNGQCTLREAISNANTNSDASGGDCTAGSGADTITAPAGDYALNGQLTISGDVTLNGAGASGTIIRNAVGQPNVLNDGDRVFNITGGTIVMNGLTIRDGDEPDGAGILNLASLTLNGVIVSDNYTVEDGAGILNTGTLVTSRSAVVFNTTGTPQGFAAGIENFGVLTATNTTIAGNRADNTAGGLFNAGTAYLDSVTIFSNTAGVSGGGLENNGTLRLRNSLIAGNAAPTGPDCRASGQPITSFGHNLIQNTAGCAITGTLTGNITGQDPLLGPLGNNGGPTPNAALLIGSPAINAGTPVGCPATDQRGVTRPQGSACDIGAFEFAKGNQTIVFDPLPDRAIGEAFFAMAATASSGLVVTFAGLTPDVCTVAGNTVTLIAVGTCTIRASQPGDAAFNAAPDVARSFTVNNRHIFLPLTLKQP